jgi:hypothetical protein
MFDKIDDSHDFIEHTIKLKYFFTFILIAVILHPNERRNDDYDC